MKQERRSLNLQKHSLLWGAFFGMHILIGLLVTAAGSTVLFMGGHWLSGLALFGSAAFALLNGMEGFRELGRSNQKPNQKYNS
ncbi:MAG TPA: hypothetical protein VGL27_14165 [Negativicutes bacterium]|jgi:hypothetical protein